MMKKKFFNTCAALFFVLGIFVQASGISAVPDTINISYGQSKFLKLASPISLSPASESVLQLAGSEQDKSNIEIVPKQTGETELDVNLFGVKVKSVKVNVHGPRQVIVGGQSIGIALYTKGALLVGMSNLNDENGNTINPAKDAGLKSGDVIETVNSTEITDSDHFMEIINTVTVSGTAVKLGVLRDGEKIVVDIYPIKDATDGKYKLGIWVRDSMAGVGTISFYNPQTMKYASLGHAVYDSDTNTLLNLKSGEIVESEIFGIKQGQEGNPGQLKGSFDSSKPKMGSIETNNDFGIYGDLYIEPDKSQFSKIMDTATIAETKPGPAKILTTIDGGGVKEYDVYIEKLTSQDYPSTKSMVIKVTDQELLEKTGGIIQGMSGSPIVQNGKVVGAVTHVFVNDPTKGYGLYAQWMLEQME